jgi:hypothetical protein
MLKVTIHLCKFISILLLLLNTFNCGSSQPSEEIWKEKYNLESNTGVLFGKIKLVEFLAGKDKDIIFYISKEQYGKPFLFDTLKNGYLLINNIPEGRYFIDIAKVSGFSPQRASAFFLETIIFKGYNCRSFFIINKQNTISYIEVTVPGDRIDELGQVVPPGKTPLSQPFYPDSCQIITEDQVLNQVNYLRIYKLKHGG